MSDTDDRFSVTFPLDTEGFLRRECPTCEREFKWLHGTENDEIAAVPDGGYFCPYCGIQSSADGWLTKAQVELVHNTVATEAIGPLIKGKGFKYTPPKKMEPLSELDDMRRVSFACHVGEPVKVLEEWRGVVYCLICGTADSPSYFPLKNPM